LFSFPADAEQNPKKQKQQDEGKCEVDQIAKCREYARYQAQDSTNIDDQNNKTQAQEQIQADAHFGRGL
jgi:hypothetical protein